MLCKIDELLLNSETNTNKSTNKDEKAICYKSLVNNSNDHRGLHNWRHLFKRLLTQMIRKHVWQHASSEVQVIPDTAHLRRFINKTFWEILFFHLTCLIIIAHDHETNMSL